MLRRLKVVVLFLLLCCSASAQIHSNTARVALPFVAPETASGTVVHSSTDVFDPTLISATWNLNPDADRVVRVDARIKIAAKLLTTRTGIETVNNLVDSFRRKIKSKLASTAKDIEVRVGIL